MTSTATEGVLTLSSIAAARIRGLRAEAGLNQTQLARQVGLSRTAVSDREAGVKPVNVDELPAFADVLGTSIEYLLGLTNDRSQRRYADGLQAVSPREPIGISTRYRGASLRLVPALEPLPEELEPSAAPEVAAGGDARTRDVVIPLSVARRRPAGGVARVGSAGGACLVLPMRRVSGVSA